MKRFDEICKALKGLEWSEIEEAHANATAQANYNGQDYQEAQSIRKMGEFNRIACARMSEVKKHLEEGPQ